MARIVHIEDDPANRLLVRKLLARAGHEVLEASDGVGGIRLACDSRPDLVLVDLAIPGLDGFEVTLRLRAEPALARVPIVAITAQGDRDTSLAVGCDGFVQKPIDARTFAGTIASYLGGERDEPPELASGRLREQSQRIVTHLEQKVAELSAANARLRDLDAARSTFYRNVTHELATPMTPVVGYVRLLLDEELGALSAAQSKALRTVEECMGRLQRTIDNLLDVTGIETGRVQMRIAPYDFAEVVRGAVEHCGPRAAEAGIRLVTELAAGPLPAVGDGPRLGRAVGQLLDNALKFTPRGGVIGVRSRPGDAGRYETCVADTGPGIPEQQLERIFEAFYQVDGSVTREHGGVGVGLAIARRTARGLGGELRAVSPAHERIGAVQLEGAAFHLVVARDATASARKG